MDFNVSIGDLIAVVALLVSAYAVWTTSKFNKRQLSLVDSQERLNKLLLEQSENESLEARKADVGATVVKLGNNRYRVKVFNKGKTAARQVRIEFPNGNDMIPDGEIEDKFPMEILEQHQSVDLVASVHFGTSRKQPAVLRWTDDEAEEKEKTVYLTI